MTSNDPLSLSSCFANVQQVRAEFHVASPLLKTREIYFARYCKQMSAANTWLVVDVSLESIYPNMMTQNHRKPSGCLIQGLENGFSKVKILF